MATPDSVVVSVDLEDVSDFPVNPKVGHHYEVAINGVGYMVQNGPEEDPKWDRGSIPLLPDRLATSETPFSQAINRYSFAATDSFEGGEGQTYMHRLGSDPKRFLAGDAIDPFEPGLVSIGPRAVTERVTSYPSPHLAVVGNTLFVASADDALDYKSTGGSWATLSDLTDSQGPIEMTDLTSDGVNWYAATGRSIIRGTTSDPGADWATIDAVHVQYAAGRVVAAVKANSTTPNRFTTLNDDGDEEESGGHLTFPEGHTVLLGGATQGQFFFAEHAGGEGSVYSWRLGVNESGEFYTPIAVWTIPRGSTVIGIGVAGGFVWIQIVENGSNDLALYQGVPTRDGFWVVKAGWEEEAGLVPRGFCAEWNETALVSWPKVDGRPGLGAVGLAAGGFVKYATAPSEAQWPFDVDVWGGTPVMSDTDGEVWRFTTDPSPKGRIATSIADGGSALAKVWDDVTLTFWPLSTGEKIEVEVSTDGGKSYVAAGEISGAGVTSYSIDLGLSAPSLGVRVTMHAGGSGPYTSPKVSLVSARYHPLGLADGILVLPIVCSDRQRGLDGFELEENGTGRGAAVARELEALAQTRVRVQDIDWPYTNEVETYEVQNVHSQLTWVKGADAPELMGVCVVELRKPNKGFAT